MGKKKVSGDILLIGHQGNFYFLHLSYVVKRIYQAPLEPYHLFSRKKKEGDEGEPFQSF